MFFESQAHATPITFDFDSGTPPPAAQSTSTPFNLTVSGLTAHFSSPQDFVNSPAFSLQSHNTTFYTQILLTGNYLWPDSVFKNVLDISFSQPITDISSGFCHGRAAGSRRVPLESGGHRLQQLDGQHASGLGGKRAGTYGSTTYPEGTLSFSSVSTTFDHG